MKKPTVSVCIPTYNGEAYLRGCLESVIHQTCTELEILIVDDQSSDGTIGIAQEYAQQDPRVRLVVNPQNLGLVGNWNRCIELAQGDWIKFVFQDDLIAPDCIEKMLVADPASHPIVCCRRDFIFEAGVTDERKQYYLSHPSMDTLFQDTTKISANDFCEVALSHIGVNFVGEPTAVMLHRSIFAQVGFFNPHLIMICDLEFWTRVAVRAGIVYIPESLASFRVHGQAASSVNYSIRQFRGWILDGVVLRHDFLFHSVYKPLRDLCDQMQLDALQRSFQANVLEASGIVQQTERNGVSGEQRVLDEWNEVIDHYPVIRLFSKVNRTFQPLKQIRKGLRKVKQLGHST
jgi:glycosyltransferase involved in cell wall biosynthesis